MIHIVAVITAHPGKRDELLEAFCQVLPLVHKEKGCVEYQPLTDAEGVSKSAALLGKDVYMVIEKWDSIDDVRAHASSSHMADFQQKTGHLVADRKVHVLN